jgi:hypothetical protein
MTYVADLYEGDPIFNANTIFRLVGFVFFLLPVDEIQMVDIIFRNGRCDALKLPYNLLTRSTKACISGLTFLGESFVESVVL